MNEHTSSEDNNEIIEEENKGLEEKQKRLFPLRLEFFTIIFFAFIIIAVILLNFTPPDTDLYQGILDWIRIPLSFGIVKDIYRFIVPVPQTVEALYISTSLLLTFFSLSLLSAKEKFQDLLFEGKLYKRLLIQIGFFFLFMIIFMHFLNFIKIIFPDVADAGINIIFLSIGASIWLFLQSWALFTAARRSATGLEGFFSSHNNKISYFFVLIMPFLVATFIFLLSFGFLCVINYVGPFIGYSSTLVWQIMVEIALFSTLLLCIIPFIITIRSKNRRQKGYDNLVVILTNFFMYPYILFNFTIFFFLNPDTLNKISAIYGTGSTDGFSLVGQILIIIESAFTFFALILALRTVGKRTHYRLGFLNKYGFIFAVYGALTGQFGIRYLQSRGQLAQSVPDFFNLIFINSQHLIINIGVILAIAIAIIVFKTKKFGVIYRVHDEISKEDLKRIEFIYDYLKKEYIRRNELLNVLEMYEIIAQVLKLDQYDTVRLINKADMKYNDLIIEGLKKRYVYFKLEQKLEQN
ncbi:MAG: hypothetical protein ACTSVE_05820 [Candidatus Helarchaeota archaeon]